MTGILGVESYRAGDVGTPTGARRMAARLVADGLALVAGVVDRAAALRVADGVMRVDPHPDGDADGVTVLTDRGEHGQRPGAAGFSRRGLLPHTDRSGVPDPPGLLLTVCVRPADSGGSSILVDGRAVYDDLLRTAPGAIPALRRSGSALFGGPGGHCGAVLAGTGSRCTIRLRLDDRVLVTPEVAAWLPTLRAAIDRHMIVLDLAGGEGFLLDNHRWLHGRTAYSGPRVLHRLLGRPLPTLGLRAGIPVG